MLMTPTGQANDWPAVLYKKVLQIIQGINPDKYLQHNNSLTNINDLIIKFSCEIYW